MLLVHGGAGPASTWAGLEELRERWTLRYLFRRGYGASPDPLGGRQDFAVDAADLAPLLASRPHVVAHSYGCHAVLHAAAADPAQVRSLTLIEPPLYFLNEGDGVVERLARMGDEMLLEGESADPVRLREFLRISGVEVDDGPLPDAVTAGVRRAHGGRLPSESRPDLAAIRAAGVPALVASGEHEDAIERICDALAGALDAERLRAAGGSHFVARAPAFAPALEAFLRKAEPRA